MFLLRRVVRFFLGAILMMTMLPHKSHWINYAFSAMFQAKCYLGRCKCTSLVYSGLFPFFQNSRDSVSNAFRYALPFEQIEDPRGWTVDIFQRYWYHTITISILYFATVKGGQIEVYLYSIIFSFFLTKGYL